MRGVVQRVLSGSVSVGGREISRIQRGIVVLVGISDMDTEKDLQYLCKKLLATRLWSSEDDRPWAKSVVDMGFDVLLVSQFTLYASIKSASVFLGVSTFLLSLLPCHDARFCFFAHTNAFA
jgi:D-tyrosyl-tRNA(Tyr) deacylase